MDNNLVWHEIGADDFTAMSPCKMYFLRVEQMDRKKWWWNVECLSSSIDSGIVTSKEDAFALAKKTFMNHSLKNTNKIR